MAGTNKIATNKWIKEYITPAYTYNSDDENKCPSISFINSCSKNLISVSGVTNYSGNTKLVKENNLSVGSRTKAITFNFWNANGINMQSLWLGVSRPGLGTYKLLNESSPRDSTGTTTYTVYAPLFGKGCRLQLYANTDDDSRDDHWYWYDDSFYTSTVLLGYFSNGTGHTYTFNNEYDSWVIKTTTCTFEFRD